MPDGAEKGLAAMLGSGGPRATRSLSLGNVCSLQRGWVVRTHRPWGVWPAVAGPFSLLQAVSME